MARTTRTKVKSLPRPISLGSASSSVGGHYAPHVPHIPPFGPAMAASVFDLWSWDAEEACSDSYDERHEDINEEDFYDGGELQSYHFSYQEELELETVEELETKLRQQLKTFERAYNKMCHYALKWHYLQQDVEKNPQIEKMFKDMQIMRKLSGSNNV